MANLTLFNGFGGHHGLDPFSAKKISLGEPPPQMKISIYGPFFGPNKGTPQAKKSL